ncbi:MAG: aminopeptidase, partial [Clostridia bacterium]|nr:aminopeptidase [Clostridia bacterium]
NMSEDDFKEVGFNDSVNHVDFMVGSPDLSIIGYDFEGKSYEIFKDGLWAI